MRMKKRLLAGVVTVCLLVAGFPVGFFSTGKSVLAKEKTGTVIDVTDFGADPGGKMDSTKAVQKALEKVKETKGKVTLNFPKGEYHFWKDYATKRNYHTSNTSSLSYPEKSIAILLEGVDNLTLEGNGSSLIMHGDMMAIAAVDSHNIKLHDFVLDYKDPDTVDLSVVGNGVDESGKQYADFYVPANYNYEINADKTGITWQGEMSPVTKRPYWEKSNADFCAYLVIYKGYDQTVARASNKAASNPFANVASIEKAGENVLRFTYNGERPKDQEVGNIFLLSDSATRKTTGAFFWESEDVLVENIDVHYLSGFGWLTQMCKNVEFKGVDFLPRYATGKYTTSNADQLHVAGCGGYFKVTDCNFSMSHDDPINVHGSYMRVEEIIDNRTLKLKYIHSQQGGFRQFHKGDEVLFYSRTYLELPDGSTEENPYIVESSVAPGEEYNGEKLDMRTEVVTFKEAFSEETLNDLKIKVRRNNSEEEEGLYVAENVSYTAAVTISGNHMKSIPTRGILCTTRKPVVIEDNIFDNMTMANIYLSNDANYWYESGPIRNMKIRNNKFYIRPTGQVEWGDVSGIFVDPVVLTSVQDAPASKGNIPVHRNISVEGNEFHMANDNVVTAEGVDGMTIKNNKIIRDNPGIEITLNDMEGLGIGETQDIKKEVKEKTLPKDIFKFTNCKNVEINGNTYDDGLNLNVTTSGDKMTEDDVEIKDDVLTLNKEGNNLITSESKVHYITSDPTVAYVNEQGQLVGVADGTVTLTAYVEWNGTMIKRNSVEIPVGEGKGTTVSIEADKTEITEEGGTAHLTITDGAEIEVLDPLTGKASNAATVKGNVYTALKEGAVLLKADKNGKSASVLMINRFPKSYGDVSKLNSSEVSVDNMHEKMLSGAKNEITIEAESDPKSDLYGANTYVTNLVKLPILEEYKNDLRIQVDVDGLVVNGDGYNNAGIVLYKDGDNYYSVGKKGHMSGVTAVYEEKASPSERGGNSADNKLTSTTFEIEIQNDTVTVRFKDASGKWKTANTQNAISKITDGKLYLAFTAWENSGKEFSSTFSNVKIAKASETTTENMNTVVPKQIFSAVSNERPTVSSVDLKADKVNTEAKVTAKASDSDGTVEKIIYEWTLENESGVKDVTYTSEGKYIPKEAGKLSVRLLAIDNLGKPSAVAKSEEVSVTVDKSDAETLRNLYINGNAVADFDKKDAKFVLPDGASSKIRVSYDPENAGVKTVIKDKDGKVTLATLTDECAAVVDMQDGLTIERGSKVYKVALHTQKEGNVNIQKLSVDGKDVNLSEDEIKSGTNSYFINTDKDDVSIRMETEDKGTAFSVKRSFFNIPVENASKDKGVFEVDVDLTAGINAFYLTVKGADGITERTVCLYLFRDGFNNSALKDLKVNGKSLPDFAPDKTEYTMYVDNPQSVKVEAVQGAQEQQTNITKNSVRTDGVSASYKLEDGLNQIVVANTSENMWTTTYYTVNVVVRSGSNADLLSLKTDETLLPGFDPLKPDVTEYAVTMNNDSIHIEAQSLMDNAKIRVFSDTEEKSGAGSIVTDMNIYEGKNAIGIEVTSPDGKVKRVYTLDIDAEGFDYASDRMDISTKDEVGYGELGLDISSSGGAIALADEKGQRVEFKKGLGAHASSEVAYNIEGQGYTAFESYIGIDYYQVSQGNVPSSVTFRVLVDGEEKYNSGEMTVKDPMKKIKIDLTGASTIQLFADMGENNYNDHADWADAKFVKSLPEKPEKPKVNKITSVDKVKDVEVAYGTKLKDIPLPKEVKVELDNGTTVELPVEWSCEKYNAEVAGKYVFTGTLTVPEGIENPDGLMAETEVTVKEKPNDTTNPDNSGNNGSHSNNNSNSNSNGSSADKGENHQGAVETGDSFGMMMWISLLAILTSAGVIVVYFLRRKNRR